MTDIDDRRRPKALGLLVVSRTDPRYITWCDVDDRGTAQADEVTAAEAGPVRLQPPLTGGPDVAYLRAL